MHDKPIVTGISDRREIKQLEEQTKSQTERGRQTDSQAEAATDIQRNWHTQRFSNRQVKDLGQRQRQTDRQRQTNRQTDSQAEAATDIQRNWQTQRFSNRQVKPRTETETDRQTETDKQTDRQSDIRKLRQIFRGTGTPRGFQTDR